MKTIYKHIIFGMSIIAIFIAIFTNCSCYERRFTKAIDMVLEKNEMPYSDNVIDNIFAEIRKCPSSLNFQLNDWNDLGSKKSVVTSDDNVVRAYTMERFGFGGNPSLRFDTRTLIQYRQEDSVKCFEFEENNGVISRILKIKEAEGYYLVEYFHGRIGHNQISLYVYNLSDITPKRLSNAFKSGSIYSETIHRYWEDYGHDEYGNELESICIPEEYSQSSSVFYNQFSNTLYVSNTEQFGPGYVLLNGTYSKYKWNNGHFEQIFPNYKIEARNKDYYICIVHKEDGSCTYHCWNDGVKKGTPDLVVTNGIKQYENYNGTYIDYDSWITDDESTPVVERYLFTNNGYRYEYYSDRSSGMNYVTLYVYSPSDKLLYTGSLEIISK